MYLNIYIYTHINFYIYTHIIIYQYMIRIYEKYMAHRRIGYCHGHSHLYLLLLAFILSHVVGDDVKR